MRISDWSSDVCSSDLRQFVEIRENLPRLCRAVVDVDDRKLLVVEAESREIIGPKGVLKNEDADSLERSPPLLQRCFVVPPRSEEHTSELQSLMRISYAVFCLKKKKKTTSTITNQSKPSIRQT